MHDMARESERIYHKCTELWKNHVFDRDSIHSSVHLVFPHRRERSEAAHTANIIGDDDEIDGEGTHEAYETRSKLLFVFFPRCCTTIKMDKMFVLNVDLNSPI